MARLLWAVPWLLATASLSIAGVRVEFNPYRPAVGPFPNDLLTVADDRQRTGLRVNLPMADCAARPSDCAEFRQLNQLDGFSPNPRLTVKFSGPINPDTLRDGVFFVYLDQVSPGRFALEPAGRMIPINQVVYDPATFTAYAKPDAVLEGSRRFLVAVTTAVKDPQGAPVERDGGFDACLKREVGGDYCRMLSAGVTGLGADRVAGASLFTTLSTATWFEQARAVLPGVPSRLRPQAAPRVLPLANLAELTIREQTGADRFEDFTLPLPGSFLSQNGVGSVAFGSVLTPRFLGESLTIPIAPTGVPLPPPQGTDELFFHAWLPSRPRPESGYPVLLVQHGFNDSRWGIPSFAALAAGSGYAVVATNAFGHGFGPRSTARFRMTDGSVEVIPAPGRGVDFDGDGRIGASEGCIVLAPGQPIGFRDCTRQSVVDLMQLVRSIRDGMDLDGDGRPDLDGRRIQLLGQSLGGAIGTVLAAVEPLVTSAVINVAPGSEVDAYRWSRVLHPTLGVEAVSHRNPSLLNRGQDFDDDFPLRWEPVRRRTLAGAAELQEFFERAEWLAAVATPTFLAPHLKQATLPGAPIKRVLFQLALGDRTVPNPSTSALIRAANMREQTTLYRADLAEAAVPAMPDDPHAFLAPLGPPQALFVAVATLQQAILFFDATTDTPPDVNSLVRGIFGRDIFETPLALPERP